MGSQKLEYLSGYLSVPRNPLIANIFFRLNYIEMFGTGILRIKQAYVNEIVSPKFKVTPNALVVILPVLNVADDLSADEWQVLAQFEADKPLSKRQLVAQTNLSASKISRILLNLVEKNLLTKIGAGRATQYHK
ncbi:ATP-binding protein [Ligilactobacillus apodemi]|uniref:ATP-binding protein n=1 Tax=Ligilactobacillus apodemi TaxID=307126 RepID=UPI00214B9C23|nr:ATP-binding protein [Ligilactobacillus apodemi]MCR1901980.1 MarR family transcriptional regulator [Ligilactobacillus apodemi]